MKKESDSVIPLSRFRVELSHPDAHERAEALLAAADPAAAVAALAVPDYYFLVKELGFDEGRGLLALATADQVRGCFDLECWNRDRVEVPAAMRWMAALADVSPEKLAEGFGALDPELAALLLRRGAEILDLTLGEAPDEADERPIYATPDGFFAVVITAEREEEIDQIHKVVDFLYRGDADVARRVLMAARSELDSDLEETAYRWRSGRMADLGYVDFYDALEVYRPLEASEVAIGEGSAAGPRAPRSDEDRPGRLPVPVADRLGRRSFLARALEQITSAAETERLEAALLYLVNHVLSAARVSPGDDEAVKVGTEHAAATLSLGLEVVAAGNLEQAVAALESISISRLHRVGYSTTVKLARLAALLAPRAGSAGEPSESVLSALLGRRPFFPAALEGEEGRRAFGSLADIRAVAEHLHELTARIALAEALGVDLIAVGEAARGGGFARRLDAEPGPELDDHVRTAIARNLGGGPFEASPLTAEELDALLGAAFDDGELTEAARTRAAAGLVGVLDRGGITAGREVYPALLSRWLDELAETFGGLEPGESIDPAAIGGVITSLAKE